MSAPQRVARPTLADSARADALLVLLHRRESITFDAGFFKGRKNVGWKTTDAWVAGEILVSRECARWDGMSGVVSLVLEPPPPLVTPEPESPQTQLSKGGGK